MSRFGVDPGTDPNNPDNWFTNPPLVTVEQAWPPPAPAEPASDPTPYINLAVDIFGRAVARPGVVYAPPPAPLPGWVVPAAIAGGVLFLLSLMKSSHRRRRSR